MYRAGKTAVLLDATETLYLFESVPCTAVGKKRAALGDGHIDLCQGVAIEARNTVASSAGDARH